MGFSSGIQDGINLVEYLMFKEKTRIAFLILRLFGDILVIPASFIIGYIIKFKLYLFGLGIKVNPVIPLKPYLNVLGYIICLWLLAFVFSGMYKNYTGPLASVNESLAIIKGVAFGTLEVMAFTFLYPTFPESRFVLAYAALTAIITLIIVRNIISSFQNMVHKIGLGNKSTIIIGHDTHAQRIAEKIINFPEFGFQYSGFVFDRQPKNVIHPLMGKIVRFSERSELKKQVLKNHIEAIFLADNEYLQEEVFELAEFCEQHNIYFRYLSSEYQRNIGFDMLDVIPLYKVNKISFSLPKRIIKRTFDLTIAIPLTLLALPIMILIALLIMLTSPGPIIYRQKRVTEYGKEFNFLKFRSMPHDIEKNRPVLSITDQKNRTTGIGYWLRKTSLDELLQLINVIKGDMSIVGPRPERPFFHNEYIKTIPYWGDRLLVRGGITGWAQLNGRAQLSALPYEKLEYDLYYIENWSILFDLKIILNTIFHVTLQKDVF